MSWMVSHEKWDKTKRLIHLAGNVGICVCRLHPPNGRHLCLLLTCRQSRPNTLATFSSVGLFFADKVLSENRIPDTLFYMYVPHKSHKLIYKIYNVAQWNVLLLVQLKCYV